MIAVIDYGLGNLGSIVNMLRVLGEKASIVSTAEELRGADKMILPGVGAFDAGMSQLNASGLRDEIMFQVTVEKKPLLGICLGMQMLGRGSEEGSLSGLGLIPFESRKFQFEECGLKVPHMGWDLVSYEQPENPLVKNLSDGDRYYFVHSYHAICDSDEYSLMSCDYGYRFTAAVCRSNVYGVQFHPEKSHNFGLRLLKNFVEEC